MKLRSYQTEAIGAILGSLKKHDKVGAVLPTGSGKSLVMTSVIDAYAAECNFQEAVLVCCHMGDVVRQLQGVYEQFGTYGKKSMVLTGKEKPRAGTRVIFSTMQQLMTPRQKKFWTDSPMRKAIRMVVIDEAHLYGCESYHILSHDLFPLAKYVGLSATPFRKNQFSFSQFDHVAYSVSPRELIDKGYLVPPRLYDMALSGMDDAERYAACIKVWRLKECARKLPSIVYLPTIEKAQEFRLVCEADGIGAALVTGKTNDAEWIEIRERITSGKLDMIVNVKKLDVGIDLPNVGSIMMPYATKSVVTYLQRIGRALRPFPGKTHANVYVFGDAPSVQSGFWERLHNAALEAKTELTPVEKLLEEIVDMEEEGTATPGRIAWTRMAIKACEILLQNKMPEAAELISEHRFPPKYAKAIDKLIQLMPTHGTPRGKSTEAQISILRDRYKFRHRDASRLDYRQAESILVAMERYYQRPFIIQTGPFAGVHMSETPAMYRRNIKDTDNKLLWQRWIKAGRPKQENPLET